MFRIKNLIRGTFMLSAPISLTASFVPMAVGFSFAVFRGGASFVPTDALWIIVSFIAMALIETAKHGVNDIFDYLSGNDGAVDSFHRAPVSGGKRVLTENVLTLKETAFVSLMCFGGAGILGLLIVFFKSPSVLPYGILGIIISILYSLPPIKLCYRGLGEAAVGIVYGPLVCFGAYRMLEEGQRLLDPAVFPLVLISIYIAFLIINVLVINEFPDYEADVFAGKKNLVARVGKDRGCIWFLGFFLISFVPVIALFILEKNPLWLILFVFLIPMLAGVKNAKKYKEDIPKLLLSNFLTIGIHIVSGIVIIAVLAIGE